MSAVPGIPNIRVIIREASNENLVVDVPNISVTIVDNDQYNVNITPNAVVPVRTGSFSSYADLAGQANTASYALLAQTLIGTVQSASYASTASYVDYTNVTNLPSLLSSSTQVDYTQIQNQPTTIPTASYILNAVSASYALTASYVSGAVSTWDNIANKPNGLVSSSIQIVDYNIFATTGSNTFVGNQIAPSFTGSLYGTASWAQNAITASYAVNAGAGAGFPFSGSAVITGSLLVSSSGITVLGTGVTASLFGTSSWATNAISSSFSTTSSFSVSSSRAVTSSFTVTSSYAVNADLLDGLNSTVFATTGSNTFNGNQTITGSLLTNADTIIFTGSIFTSGSLSVVAGTITGSLFGTASYASTASYIDGGLY